MNIFNLNHVLVLLICACSSPKPSRMVRMQPHEFERVVPAAVKKSLDQSYLKPLSAYICPKYRGADIDVVWLWGYDYKVKSWIVKRGEWTSLQGNTQEEALTKALRTDIRVLNALPSDEDIKSFCYEIIQLLSGGGGSQLDPSFAATVNKVHRIEQSINLTPEDKTYLLIRGECKPIKYICNGDYKTIIFRQLSAGGGVDEWSVTISKKAVTEVKVKVILKKSKLLKRWIPTG